MTLGDGKVGKPRPVTHRKARLQTRSSTVTVKYSCHWIFNCHSWSRKVI